MLYLDFARESHRLLYEWVTGFDAKKGLSPDEEAVD